MEKALGTTQEATSVGTAYFEPNCFFKDSNMSTLIIETILYIILPLFMVAMIMLVLFIMDKISTPEVASNEDNQENNLENTAFMPTKLDIAVALSAVVFFFFHPTLVAQSALFFDCEIVGYTLQEHDYRL